MDLYNRWAFRGIKEALGTRRVLLLAGARQVGKTTLSWELSKEDVIYRTLDDWTVLQAAQSDPEGFIQHGDNLLIIDEVQRAPKLIQAIKADVDRNQKPGRFLLTGSANIRYLPTVQDSLAGRVCSIRLRSLAMGERLGKNPKFLERAFVEEFSTDKSKKYTKEDYLEIALKGGYPEALRLEVERESRQWYRDYVMALVERDLQDIVNIRRKDAMFKLIEYLAAWSSKQIDISQLGRGLSIQRPTILSYINALEALFLVDRLSPWTKTDYDRVGRQDKFFISDSGLMSAILNWSKDKVALDGELNGKLLETFVYTELASILEASREEYELSYYRDRLKREIDFIVTEGDKTLAIEVKASVSVSKDAFKHLEWFHKNLSKGKPFVGVVLYTGEEVLRFGEKLWAVPMSALWG